eukprot:UN02409
MRLKALYRAFKRTNYRVHTTPREKCRPFFEKTGPCLPLTVLKMNFSLKYYILYGKENFGGAGTEPPRKFFEICKNLPTRKNKIRGP